MFYLYSSNTSEKTNTNTTEEKKPTVSKNTTIGWPEIIGGLVVTVLLGIFFAIARYCERRDIYSSAARFIKYLCVFLFFLYWGCITAIYGAETNNTPLLVVGGLILAILGIIFVGIVLYNLPPGFLSKVIFLSWLRSH